MRGQACSLQEALFQARVDVEFFYRSCLCYAGKDWIFSDIPEWSQLCFVDTLWAEPANRVSAPELLA
jgi:hypothetical protein